MKKIVLLLALLLILPSAARGITIREPVESGTDYGDAPAPYPSAEHGNQDYEWLGTLPYVDDGVSWSAFILGQPAWVTFSASAAPGTMAPDWGWEEYVNIWIDWGQSGSWETTEQAAHWYGLVPLGTNTLVCTFNFTVPTDALIGNTWMRARLAWDDDVGPSGETDYGECEDYMVSVISGGEVPIPIPEPATMLLFGAGLAGIGLFRRKRFFKK